MFEDYQNFVKVIDKDEITLSNYLALKISYLKGVVDGNFIKGNISKIQFDSCIELLCFLEKELKFTLEAENENN